MNKAAIKNFAVWARAQLIEATKRRAYEYEITEEGENKAGLDTIDGRLLSAEEKKQRQQLIDEIRRKGYTQVMEEAAYTWFNRFIALRYMEVNGYLPSKVRVFTDEAGAFKPDILKEAITVEIEGLDRNKVLDLLDKQDNESLYKYLLITQCNALNQGLPYMFEKISNWTELLFPANLLRPDSVIDRMVNEIPEEDWQDAVQIIGWLYQYYNSELKDDTFALLKKNVKISKERIPAATQLFTPDWIVRYMVENSLGRLWFEGHPNFDKSQWKYYLDEAPQEPEVELQLQKIRADYANMKPEDIKVIDPCMGSGHILVYAFDVLLQIYTSCGWSERDAAKSIIENNLYGLDIDDRAGQLAYFAVMMKARKYSRRILNSGITPNVFSIQDSSFMSDDFITFVANKDHELELDLIGIRNAFVDAKEYGSILSVPKFDYEKLYTRVEELKSYFPQTIFESEYRLTAIEKLYQIVKQAEMLHQKYDVVVTNPPYMGASGMGNKLTEFAKKNYPDSKSDLFAVFIERCGAMLKLGGYQAMITMHTWMFLKSFEKLRLELFSLRSIINVAYLGIGAFGSGDVGTIVQTASFCLRNLKCKKYKGTYAYLCDENTTNKEKCILEKQNLYVKEQGVFNKIPGNPVAFWLSDKLIEAFSMCELEKVSEARIGLVPGNNAKYIRLWTEVPYTRIGFSFSRQEAADSKLRWFPYNKGGQYRKWYGNLEYIVDWFNDGYEMQTTKHPDGSRLWAHNFNLEYIFSQHIGWTDLAMELSFRFYPRGIMFDSSSNAVFTSTANNMYLLGYLNSNFVRYISNVLNPTFHFKPGDYYKLPFVSTDSTICDEVEHMVEQCVDASKCDWDSFETSWDFKKHPLI